MTKAEVLEKLPKSLRDDVVYEPWPDVHTHTTESRTEQVITIRGVYKPVPVKTRGQEIAERMVYECPVNGSRLTDAAHSLASVSIERPKYAAEIIAVAIDAAIIEEREACEACIMARTELTDFDNAYNHGATDAVESIERRTTPNYRRKGNEPMVAANEASIKAAIAETKEAAAKLCDVEAHKWKDNPYACTQMAWAMKCADAIRAMKQ